MQVKEFAGPSMRSKRFGDEVHDAIVLCYKEDVSLLVSALESEHINTKVQRASYSEKELSYTSASRCFLNHVEAWKVASRSAGYTLICESDFVPCRGLRDFPLFWPLSDAFAWGYLYQGSPRLLALIGKWPFFLRGHAAPLVAYVINAPIAEILLEFFEYEKSKYSLTEYFTFDAHLQWFVMGKGGRAFIPWRHYGEHGGLPNPEHRLSGQVSAAGRHHADNLMGPLHFLPLYARGSLLRYWSVRARWRGMGFIRLVGRRWISYTDVYIFSKMDVLRMNMIGLARLLPNVVAFRQNDIR